MQDWKEGRGQKPTNQPNPGTKARRSKKTRGNALTGFLENLLRNETGPAGCDDLRGPVDGAGRGYVFPIALGKTPQNQDGPRSSPCRPDGHRSSGWSITPDSGQVECPATSTNFSPLVLPGILNTFKHYIFPMKLSISFHLAKLLSIKSGPFHLSGYCGCFLEARSRPPSRQWPPLVALGALREWQGSHPSLPRLLHLAVCEAACSFPRSAVPHCQALGGSGSHSKTAK